MSPVRHPVSQGARREDEVDMSQCRGWESRRVAHPNWNYRTMTVPIMY